MNDQDDVAPLLHRAESGPTTLPPVALKTAGQLLTEARQASGLTLEVLSGRLKIPVHRLLALEQDRFDQWPNTMVVRAVAASVGRHLGMDTEQLLSRLPQPERAHFLERAAQAPVGFRSKRLAMRQGDGALPMQLSWLAGVLVLGAVVLFFAPAIETTIQSFWQVEVDVPQGVEPLVQEAAGPQAEVLAPPESDSTEAKAAAAEPGATPANGASAQAAATPLLRFVAKGATWIEVRDAKGDILLRRTLVADEAVVASGDLPLSVVVGKVDLTVVEFRGKVLNLEASGPDNVARFKVQ